MQVASINVSRTRRLVICGLCLAFALVMKLFSIMVPMLGFGAMRISLIGIFTTIPALAFGPLYGAIVGGLSDFVGWVIKPEGAWIPLLTLTSVLAGLMKAYLWILVGKLKAKSLVKIFIYVFGFMLVFGSINIWASHFYANSVYAGFLHSLKSGGQSQLAFATILPVCIGAVGLLLIWANSRMEKHRDALGFGDMFLKVFFIMLFSGIIICTVNTFILINIFGIQKAFLLFYLPRIIEEIAMAIILSYLLSIVYPLAQKRLI